MPKALEAIYYSAPIPRNAGTLTILGAVFDKVYFPGVYLPKGGFDQGELDKEIARLRGLNLTDQETVESIAMLDFVRHVRTLEGLCEFTGSSEDVFGSAGDVPEKFVDELFQVIHGPNPEGWTPIIPGGHHMGIPGSDETVNWPGRYYYMGNAIIESADTQIPLVNDMAGIPLPGLNEGTPADDAQILSTILSIECAKLVLPNLPLLTPVDLMEFREENSQHLQAFRNSMLRYASNFNDKIIGVPADQIPKKTRFFVDTEIAPALDELREAINAPARAWHKRAIDFIKVTPMLGAACFAAEPTSAIVSVLTSYAGSQYLTELGAAGDKAYSLKRSGLYYMLQLEAHKTE